MKETSRAKDKKLWVNNDSLDKGISCNALEVLHNVYPNKSVALSIQRLGRISRTAEGKTKAIVYDYIYDHPIFINQFYNKKKDLSRLHAWMQCSDVPNYVGNLIDYLEKKQKRKSYNQQDYNKIKKQIIDVDNIELLIKEDSFYDR